MGLFGKNNNSDININDTIYNDYYKKFFTLFNRVNRPIICYLDNERKVNVLGVHHINVNRRNEEFLDIMQLGHNSPYEFKLSGGIIGAVGTIIEIILEEKRKTEIHINRLRLSQLEIETAELVKMREKIRLIDEVLDLYEKRQIQIDYDIVNRILGSDIENIEKTIQKSTKNLMYNNKMKLIQTEIGNNFDDKR